MPRHRGLGEECTTFFHKGARSNPVASFARRERNKREKLNEFGNEKRRARKMNDQGRVERARSKQDSNLKLVSGKKRLDSKDVNVN